MNLDNNSSLNSLSIQTTPFRNQLDFNQAPNSNVTQSHFISIDENETLYPRSQHEINSTNNSTSLTLKQQAMLNQFISIAGCSYEQAKSLLSSSNWQYQVSFVAYSNFG